MTRLLLFNRRERRVLRRAHKEMVNTNELSVLRVRDLRL